MRADLKSVRTQSSRQYLLMLLVSASVKAVRRTLMKLSPNVSAKLEDELSFVTLLPT